MATQVDGFDVWGIATPSYVTHSVDAPLVYQLANLSGLSSVSVLCVALAVSFVGLMWAASVLSNALD